MSGPGDRSMEDWTGEIGDRWLAHIDTFESMIAPAGDALLAHAAFRPGESVVDIGCGGGATTLAIGRAVGPAGRVTGVDVAPQLVARAGERLAADGAPNVAFETLDAQTGTPAGAPFDRAFSRFGVMFFDDTDAAFANIRAWLKPGGRLTFGCWAAPDDNPWMGMATRIVGQYAEMPPRDPEGPGPFRMADPEATRAMLARVGFADIAIAPWHGEQLIGGAGADPARAARFVLDAMGMRAIVAEQAPSQIGALEAALQEAMTPLWRDGSVRTDAAIWLVDARASR